MVAMAYIGIANRSPCVVPFLENITSPSMNNSVGTLYVLISRVEMEGQRNLMLLGQHHSLVSLTIYVDLSCIFPLLASHLIALDKNPGVRPISIGQTSRRIITKAVLTVILGDVQDTAGSVQLCAVQEE